MKISNVILALCLGMLLYRITSDALTEGGKVDTARGLGRLVNRVTTYWNPKQEMFSPYYFPKTTTTTTTVADTLTIPKSSRTIQESTRVATNNVPRATVVTLGTPLD
jgi:hypothetical protein